MNVSQETDKSVEKLNHLHDYYWVTKVISVTLYVL